MVMALRRREEKGEGDAEDDRTDDDRGDDDLEDLYEFVTGPKEEEEDEEVDDEEDEGEGMERCEADDDEEDTDPDDASSWEWTFTNIGALLVMVALLISVVAFVNLLVGGVIYTILSIPIVILLVVGYSLVLRDEQVRRKVRREKKQKRRKGKKVRRRKGT